MATERAAAVAEHDRLQAALRDSSTITDQAQQLLAGKKDTALDPKSMHERFQVLSREIQVLGKTIEIQNHKVDAEKGAASQMICATYEQAYREKLQRFRGAIDDLNAAAGEVHQNRTELRNRRRGRGRVLAACRGRLAATEAGEHHA